MKPKANEEQLIGWADAALAGDVRALEALLDALKDPLFRLALRMLGNFADAEDATQEVLVKITTALASFERRSALRTWAFRIATNHVNDLAVARRARQTESFEALAEKLDAGNDLADRLPALADRADPVLELEAREMGQRCTQGMLLCLDVDSRCAFVLGEVFDFDTRTAAQILGIAEPAYRQRLSRARRALEEFMAGHCGLIDPAARCNCRRLSVAARAAGRSYPMEFARRADGSTVDLAGTLAGARAELSRLQRIAVVYRTHPDWDAPAALVDNVRRVLEGSALTAAQPQRLN
ncbi:MAG: RNA polymerase sigma factor [Betaproteobacteria bacterium]